MSEETFDPKEVVMEVTFTDVDPEVLAYMTGGVVPEPEGEFAVEVLFPKKRRFWQWLLRKPKQYRYVMIPHAKFENLEGLNGQ